MSWQWLFLLAACRAELAPPPAPTELVPLISGEELAQRISANTGQTRVVNFWATWCAPCAAEMPELKRFAAAQGTEGAQLLLVNTNTADAHRSAVLPFVHRHGLEGLDGVQLDSMDPPKDLDQAVPGWPGSLPFTLIVRADGSRAELLARPVTQADLDASVSASQKR